MWLASVWSFVFQTVKEAGAEGKHSVTADAEIMSRSTQSRASKAFHGQL